MKMFAQIALAATALVAAAAPAAAETYSFIENGVRFEVQDTTKDGVRTIEGKDSNGAAFAYRVRGTQVSGTYAGEPVFFTVPSSAKTAKVASR